MFEKLFGRNRPEIARYPLATAEGTQSLVNDLPKDPEHRLIEAGEWLSTLPERTSELGVPGVLRAMEILDGATREAAYAVLERYFSGGKRGHAANALLDALSAHLNHLLAVYGVLVGFKPPGTVDELTDKQRGILARSGARALRAWMLQKRLGRFRYRPATESSWRFAHDVLATMGQCGVLQSPVILYDGEPSSTPFREYLLGVYFELAPLGNLDPAQQELLGRFLVTQPALECMSQPGALSTHRINLHGNSGPQRHEDGVAPPAGDAVWRYLSYARLRPALLNLDFALRSGTDIPEWVKAMPIEQAPRDAAVNALLTHWAPNPPQRRDGRLDHNEPLLAAFGFVMARRFVAATQFARSGRSLRYDIIDPDEMYKLYQLESVNVTKDDSQPAIDETSPVVNPIDVLHKLELAGDRAMMENWLQIDSSSAGIGVTVPALLPRHLIGGLVAVRFVDGFEWRIGIIRRIGRDAKGKPGLGLEMLEWPSLSATVRLVPGEGTNWVADIDDGYGWTDALLVSEGHDELILPAGAFREKLNLDLRSELGLNRVCLVELIERGSDFERIRFQYR